MVILLAETSGIRGLWADISSFFSERYFVNNLFLRDRVSTAVEDLNIPVCNGQF